MYEVFDKGVEPTFGNKPPATNIPGNADSIHTRIMRYHQNTNAKTNTRKES